MNTHLEPQIRHSGVTNLGNRPAITCNLCLAVTNLDAQSAVPRINRDALKAISGVSDAKFDLKTCIATVDGEARDSDIIQVIEDAGFKAAAIEATAEV